MGGRRGERAGAQHDRVVTVGDRVQERGLGARLTGAHAHRDQHRELADPPGEEIDAAQRGHIGPVAVVEDEQVGPLVGEGGDQPVEPVQGGEGAVDAGLGLGPRSGPGPGLGGGRSEHGSGQRRGAGEELRPALGGRAENLGLEELADHPVGVLALEL